MNKEIERKFLVRNDTWKGLSHHSIYIIQGYLSNEKHITVRCRITNGSSAHLCVKVASSISEREEYEYPIDVCEAEKLLQHVNTIEKFRHVINAGNIKWEVDVFENGLVLAEVELTDINQVIDLPEWIGEEVTNDPAYLNYNMILK